MYTTIYSKYSNERDPRLAIRTDILEDEDGNRIVRKLSEYPEGEAHVAALYHWYQVLSSQLADPYQNIQDSDDSLKSTEHSELTGDDSKATTERSGLTGDDSEASTERSGLTGDDSGTAAGTSVFARNCFGLIPVFSRLTYNRCQRIPGGVELEYISGESLEDHLLSILRTRGADACAEEFLQYLHFVRSLHTGALFEPCDTFRAVFGDVALPPGTVCAPFTNIELLCENVYLSCDPLEGTDPAGHHSNEGAPAHAVSKAIPSEAGSSRKSTSGIGTSKNAPSWRTATVIDYEWSFDFPIPVNYLLYRIIFYFTAHASRGEEFARFDFPGKMGITNEEIAVYETMETNFQHYVTGTHVPARDLYDDISDGYVRPTDSFIREDLQVYFDYGEGLSEENSVLCRMKYNDCWRIQAELALPDGVKALRVDPGYRAALVHLTELRFDTQSDRAAFTLREGAIQGDWLYFTEDDPNILISSIPRGAKSLAIALEIYRLDTVPLQEIGRLAKADAERRNPLGKIKKSAKSLLKSG